ncbi:hypothetical protein FKW77_002639 [Venturia effusa]|uniref:Uncharacterized protein n=1 Tax=Venturia effusa TaxID=50376 RepID=A0A517LNI4_9PEZI|nr:hypothetical protein FKW77_002639 [Venturia effusa]
MPKATNFTQCAEQYLGNPSLIARWNYTGPVRLVQPNPSTQITYAGCKALCGTGNDWYPWAISSSFITTWVLPLLGNLLQAPFESNAFWRTIKLIARYLGSPMASLTYILWKIEVSGKCALFVDMAIPYDGAVPNENHDFASIRDSFYLLMNINQYGMKPGISLTKEAEGLLRIMLFGKDLRLLGSKKSLNTARRKLVQELRSNRRRGVVPVFLSTLWFLFSLGISIQSCKSVINLYKSRTQAILAFGYLGSNAEAHDLAVGLFMSWFPILILCSIVDRNPAAADDIQRRINKLVDLVCDSLQDDTIREEFILGFSDLPESEKMAHWVQKIACGAAHIKGNFFQNFAGQGRVRFHYGAAYAILLDIEKAYIAEHGRNWLSQEREARASLVLGQVLQELVWFDRRLLWQIMSALIFVVGTSTGAFILSYFTPTVGLSCRSGGYIIFNVIALALLTAEMAIWVCTSPNRQKRIRQCDETSGPQTATQAQYPQADATSISWFIQSLQRIEKLVTRISIADMTSTPFGTLRRKSGDLEAIIECRSRTMQLLALRHCAERYLLMPMEVCNAIWLVYLIMSQALGAFNNCLCKTRMWSSGAGYLDFTQWSYSNSSLVGQYWIIGTTISCSLMGIGIFYVLVEWCLQSHLSTENYADAMRGLQNARRFRRYTYWLRYPVFVLALGINHVVSGLRMRKGFQRRNLVWTKKSRFQPKVGETLLRISARMHQLPTQGQEENDMDRGAVDLNIFNEEETGDL